MKPLVSICIPTYNGAKYLRQCLDSILAQTFEDFEVLLVDDSSSDNTIEIANEYARLDKRIQIEKNKLNLGLVNNWNRCVELAKGEWIKFVFQDDFINKECIKKMLNNIDSETSIVCCRRDFCFEEEVELKVRKMYWNLLSIDTLFPNKTKISHIDLCNIALDEDRYNFIGEPTNVMLRREVFYRFGTFNTHLISLCDYEYWIRVAINTGLSYVPETLTTFRVHNSAMSALNREEREYRVSILDPLITLHEFTFNPLYEPIRTVAASRKPAIDLLNLLANKTRSGFKLAIQSDKKNSVLKTEKLEQWKDLVRYYPAFKMLTKKFFIHSRMLKYGLKFLNKQYGL